MKKVLSLMLVVMLCVGMMPMTAHAEETTDQPAVKYLDSYGREQEVTKYTELTADTDVTGDLQPGWYVVRGEVSYDKELCFRNTDSDPTYLILCDGAELTIDNVVYVYGNLTIYAQSTGNKAGKLVVNGNDQYGIFVDDLTINGGDITAKTEDSTNANKINFALATENITINGGTVTATAGTVTNSQQDSESYGIYAYRKTIIKNATVNATGGNATAAGNTAGSFGIYTQIENFEIYNSTVTAAGGEVLGSENRSYSYGVYADKKIIVDHSTVTVTCNTDADNSGSIYSGYTYTFTNAALSVNKPFQIDEGSFTKIETTQTNGNLGRFLKEGYAFVDDDGNVKNASGSKLENVTIAGHTHNYATESDGVYICACGAVYDKKSVAYIDENGETRYAPDYITVDSSTTAFNQSGFYVVDKDVTINGSVNGNLGNHNDEQLKLILCDNTELTISGGMDFNCDITIYAQSSGENAGKLTVSSNNRDRTIYALNNTLTVNGGVINSTNQIDSSDNVICGIYANKIVVNNGKVNGKVVKSSTLSSYGIRAHWLTVNGGTLTGSVDKVIDDNNGSSEVKAHGVEATSLIINGGTVIGNIDSTAVDKDYCFDVTASKINMKNGTIKAGKAKISTDDAIIAGGTVTGDFQIHPDFSTPKGISGGTFSSIAVLEGESPTKFIDDGCAFFDSNDNIVKVNTYQLTNVTVKPHECSYDRDSDNFFSCDCGRREDKRPIKYLDENGKTRYCTEYEFITDGIPSDWLVIEMGYTADTTFKITHDTNLILEDDAAAIFNKGIKFIDECTLTIYAQSKDENMGTMTVNGSDDSTSEGSAICISFGKLVVNGGKIMANGVGHANKNTDAIYAYDFEMNGGEVTAISGKTDTTTSTFGIYVANDLTVNGGKLTSKTAENVNSAEGICVSGDYIQTDGTVEITCEKIKSGTPSSSFYGLNVYGNATVSKGTLSVTVNETDEEVEGVEISISETMTLSGGTISATSKRENARIDGETLKMSGGEIKTEKTEMRFYNYNISGGSAFTLGENAAFYSFTVSDNFALQSFLPAGCAYIKTTYYEIDDERFDESIDFLNLNTTTQLVSSWADEKYEYHVVPCTEHSGNPCVYCGKKTSTGGGSYPPTETVTVTQPTVGGSVEVDNTAPTQGETVVVTPKKDNGYVIDTIKVTDENGKTIEISRNADGTFDFTQPDGEVTIEVTYTEKPDFKDVPKDAWYGEALDFAVENGILSGTSKTTFEPNEPMTRAMFTTVIWCYVGKPDGFTGSFNDIKNGDWFQDAVTWASKNNVVSGTGNGKFEPDLEITREQMVVMLWNFCGKPETSGKFTGFTDANKVSSWAQTAMAWAVENGIINGKGNGVLDPLGTATRAEVTTMIVNFMDK